MKKALALTIALLLTASPARACDPATALAFSDAASYGSGWGGFGYGGLSGTLSLNIPFSFQQFAPPITTLPSFGGFAFQQSFYPRYWGWGGGGFRTLPYYGGYGYGGFSRFPSSEGFAFGGGFVRGGGFGVGGFSRGFGGGSFIEQNGRRNRIVGGGFAPGTTIIQNGRRNRILR